MNTLIGQFGLKFLKTAKTDHLLSICNMKHYVSKAMLEQKINRLRQEISVFEIQHMKSANPKLKNVVHIKQLRNHLYDLKEQLLIRTNQTILKNGRK
jgi:hypothetical protein